MEGKYKNEAEVHKGSQVKSRKSEAKNFKRVAVVSWLVNVAVSEMTSTRMRTCGQRECNINPFKTPKSVFNVCTR